MNFLKKLALVLTIVGALNWGLVGIFDLNLVTLIIKSQMVVNTIYILIGIASLFSIAYFFDEKTTHDL